MKNLFFLQNDILIICSWFYFKAVDINDKKYNRIGKIGS